ncbi:MAG TPA: ACT domain-containing protein, partial [Aeromicrobium sp.]|nr:ACT domain-containing protein [Aeromicrobium sp.]
MTQPVPTVQFNVPTVLVTFTGADQKGVTGRVFEAAAGFDVEVVDVEQLIIRGRLVLSVLLTAPDDPERFAST